MMQLGGWWYLLVLVFFGLVLYPQGARATDEMRSGCAGGITGGGAGVALSRDGRVWTWQRGHAHSELKRGPLIGTDADAALRIFERAKLGGFKSIQYRLSSNRTCWVELTDDGGTHGVYWSDPSGAPALAVGLFDALQKLQRDLSGN